MRAVYRWYCRSTRGAQCSPAAVAAAVIILAVIVIGAPALAHHRAQVLTVLRAAAAVSLAVISAGILLQVAQMISRVTGTHTDTLPEPGEAAPARPARDRRPAPVAVPGLHPAYTLRPAERAEMTAEADTLARDGTGITVSEDGIYDLIEGP